ncbi:DUF1499 domain-containing protein [Psychromonas sp. 14N.309.X.WAT.B.A12]|uniref:DUF1499 domain-containing protein n=1 Tax=Psychromonas sp. 14N.309.X.WAT.B.A12 TaxID=2998322 RepID=UPI0025AF2E2C|nr:DUF1499 domain-containing protein [Psychromonas sp. 14N.309.X.WAT.B.A12]MDN2663880.1 DUF1499 domain-containing protein [Psychromonas sp. 14N.309.X.WAT.B.A12]
MNKLLYILIAIAVIIVIAFFVLGMLSKKGQALGLKEWHLQACISTENCVISEVIDNHPATIESLTFSQEKPVFMDKLKTAIEAMGGEIVTSDSSYIASTFTSGVFGFVDDVEFRITDDQQLHFRSSSRVGRKDFGANKKRIEQLKALLADQ